MKRDMRSMAKVVLFWTVIGFSITLIGGSGKALACGATCGYNSSRGGGDEYVPQQRDSRGYQADRTSITKEQAREIA